MVDWAWKFSHREEDREREAAEDGTADQERKIKELKDRFDQVHKSVHHSAFRGAVSERVVDDLTPKGAQA